MNVPHMTRKSLDYLRRTQTLAGWNVYHTEYRLLDGCSKRLSNTVGIAQYSSIFHPSLFWVEFSEEKINEFVFNLHVLTSFS